MTLLALYMLCGFNAPRFRTTPPVLRDSVIEIRRQRPVDMPTIYVLSEPRIEA